MELIENHPRKTELRLRMIYYLRNILKTKPFFLIAFLIMQRAINTSEFAPTKQSQQWW